MRTLAKRALRTSVWLSSVGLLLTLPQWGHRAGPHGSILFASTPCDAPTNLVVAENCKTDGVVGPNIWDIDPTKRSSNPTNLRFRHSAERRQRSLELRLSQTKQKVRLILLRIDAFAQDRGISANPPGLHRNGAWSRRQHG